MLKTVKMASHRDIPVLLGPLCAFLCKEFSGKIPNPTPAQTCSLSPPIGLTCVLCTENSMKNCCKVNRLVTSCQMLVKQTDSDTMDEFFAIKRQQLQKICWIDCFSGKRMYPNLVLKWTTIQKKIKAWLSYI